MKFSVLIPAYQAGKFLPQALACVLAQTHRDWELIVVEDGSHDATEGLVRTLAARESRRIHYENLGTNQGVASARNHLLSLARGDAIAFLDADDCWTPRHLSRAAEVLDAGADFAISRLQLFDLESGRDLPAFQPPPEFFRKPIAGLFAESVIMTSSCVAFRRSAVEKAGSFDPSFRIGEDRDYWMRAAMAGATFADTGEITCRYAKHSTSAMGSTLLWSQQEVAFYEKHFHAPEIPPAVRKERLSHALMNYGRLRRSDDPRASANALWRCWTLTPHRLSALPHLLLTAARLLIR